MSEARRTRRLQLIAMMLIGCLFFAFVNAKADAPLDARTLKMNGTYSGDQWITEMDDEGVYYKVVIPSDGLFEMKIMSYCDKNLGYKLFNSDLSANYEFTNCDDYVKAGSESNPSTNSASKVLSKGTYYLKFSGAVGRFKIWAKFTKYGVNDKGANSYDSPYKYTLKKQIVGGLTETDTEDWYRIKIPANGQFTLKLKSYVDSNLRYTLYSYDMSKTLFDESLSGGKPKVPKTINKNIVLRKGTYYLKLTGDKGKYVMTFSKLAATKIPSISVRAKKGERYINVKTVKSAKVIVKYNGKAWTQTTGSSSGQASFYVSSGLKKGRKITVIVTKTGFKKTTKTFTVK